MKYCGLFMNDLCRARHAHAKPLLGSHVHLFDRHAPLALDGNDVALSELAMAVRVGGVRLKKGRVGWCLTTSDM